MARPNELKRIEKEQGIPLDELIPRLVNELGGQKEVAEHLGVSQVTISNWLRSNGYEPIITYRKKEELVGEN